MLGFVARGAAPTGTIGVGEVEVLVESEPDDVAAGGGFWPLGMTMGVGLASPPPLPPLSFSESESSCGGQSTDVGGQLSAFPDPDELSEGAQPAAAPKSPAVVQSALAVPTGNRLRDPANKKAAAIHIRKVFTASGCRRRR